VLKLVESEKSGHFSDMALGREWSSSCISRLTWHPALSTERFTSAHGPRLHAASIHFIRLPH
jgi:hypothetical protein